MTGNSGARDQLKNVGQRLNFCDRRFMAKMRLAAHFKEFLRLLNSNAVEYLVIGAYAVGHHGFPRLTGDLDVWVSDSPANAARLVQVFEQFGFSHETASGEQSLKENQLIRIGVPPFRVVVLTSIPGLTFVDSFARRILAKIDGVDVPVISFDDSRKNKAASGRPKDLVDLEHLQPPAPKQNRPGNP